MILEWFHGHHDNRKKKKKTHEMWTFSQLVRYGGTCHHISCINFHIVIIKWFFNHHAGKWILGHIMLMTIVPLFLIIIRIMIKASRAKIWSCHVVKVQ